MTGKACPVGRNRNLNDHIFIYTQEADRERSGSGVRL